MIKLVILDIDGVMTDGTKLYNTYGKVIAKQFNDKDFTAIKQLKASGINVCFLSGDTNINKVIAKNRHIDFYHSRGKNGNLNKAEFLFKLYKIYSSDRNTTAYVGDDYFDLEIINELKYTFCPLDATKEIQKAVFLVIKKYAGQGVIAGLIESLKSLNLMGNYTMGEVKNIDSKES
jgi:3-deoxy-D-manno-octulosonate 8-phosphate phosphatase (KDO 8-P phosphatase)